MNTRHTLVLTLVGAVIAVAFLAGQYNDEDPAAQQSPSTTALGMTADRQVVTTTAAPPTTASLTSPAAAGPFPHPLTDSDLQAMLDQDSDLDSAQRIQLSRLGAQIVYADLTTIGVAELARTWPALWPAGPPTRAAIRDFQLNAISARTAQDGDFLITAFLLRNGHPHRRAHHPRHQQSASSARATRIPAAGALTKS